MATSKFVIDVPPVPASRPRVGKFGTYYAKGYADWMKAAATFIPKDKLTGPVSVFIEVVCKAPVKKTSCAPMGDVDNFAKGPLDVITKSGLWEDDRLVMSLSVAKRYANEDENPRTIVSVTEAKVA